MSDYIIEMLNITKEFPGIIANDNITLRLKKGEIHALLGENGAGKSTLMSVLFGMYEPEKGEIRKNGKVVKIKNPKDATRLNIGMVHQHFKLVDVFSVLDNIILGSETVKLGFLQKNKARKKVQALSDKYGLSVDLDSKIENITVGMQQRVEILKMLYRENEILIFDEPTAVLTPQETGELLKIMRSFRDEGKSILFITHKLDEIMSVCDRVTVLRKGKYIGTVDTKDTTKGQLSEMMVGRPVELTVQKEKSVPDRDVLTVENLTVISKNNKNKPVVNNVSFTARSGEILCIAGIDGNGQTPLVEAITGLRKIHSGKILLEEKEITELSVKHRNDIGISHIPEDRHKHGLILDFSLKDNFVLHSYKEKRFQ
ncbi:MAG: ABC transporter ATP-binding protein, partial [Acutalibacteraceae bacterium]|nr:ABC transporter ATP-binding protein [Acutalibacteraceae bacterium]